MHYNLLNFTRPELRNWFESLGEKSFRADQIMRWIYHKGCAEFDQMSDLNATLKKRLQLIASIDAPKIADEARSQDGTIRWSMEVDSQLIETVYIPELDRGTLCVSSQIGCAMACSFCSTGRQGFNRNLRVFEILGQVWRAVTRLKKLNPECERPVTNIVMMGMGEPLWNLANVVPAIEVMLDNFGWGISRRRVTISTSGVVPGLEKLGGLLDVALAVSLHAPTDALRNELVPLNKKYNIATLLEAVNRYVKGSTANQGRATIEYVMLRNINDSLEQAAQLARTLKGTPSKINLIPWNSFPGSTYEASSNSQIDRFAKSLILNGFSVFVRKTRGNDINAACGQLVGQVQNKQRLAS